MREGVKQIQSEWQNRMDTNYLELKTYKETGALDAADVKKLQTAAEILRAGGLVAFPTETVYGLGGNALLKEASRDIYAAKGRPSDNPLIVHIADFDALQPLVREIPPVAKLLAQKFWPGPLTLIMQKADCVPYETTGGLDTVAIRMPSHPVARELIRLAGVPVAAPSANTSGRPSPTTAGHCLVDLSGKIAAVVDGGSCSIGVESTIVDVSGEEPTLLRPGAITIEMLQEALRSAVEVDPAVETPEAPNQHPKAPGMKYRHYAPKAPMVIIQSAFYQSEDGVEDGLRLLEELHRVAGTARALADEQLAAGKRVGIICSDETFPYYFPEGQDVPLPADRHYSDGKLELYSIGSRQDERSIAHNLFALLREMDEKAVDYIIAEGVDQKKLGYAIMNRMRKAAGQHILYV